jgi:hypothetical protein
MNTTHEPSLPSTLLLSGKCLCGAVRNTVEDSFRYALNCHCSQCRRATGSAFKPFAGIERQKPNVTHASKGLLIFGQKLTHDARCASAARCSTQWFARESTSMYRSARFATSLPFVLQRISSLAPKRRGSPSPMIFHSITNSGNHALQLLSATDPA